MRMIAHLLSPLKDNTSRRLVLTLVDVFLDQSYLPTPS